MPFHPVDPETETIGSTILDSAFDLHSEVGSGIGRQIDQALRADLIVEDQVIVEVKAAVANHPHDVRQLSTYLAMTGLELGFVLNFGRARLREGIRRVINTPQIPEPSSPS